jgi:hypothetical protein
VPGRHSKLRGTVFELGHPWVTRLRVGNHPRKVRFVVEMPQRVRLHAVQQHSTLRLVLRR